MKKLFFFAIAVMYLLVLFPGLNTSGVSVYAADGDASVIVSIVGEGSAKIGTDGDVSVHSIMWQNLTRFNVRTNGINFSDLEYFKWYVRYKKSSYSEVSIPMTAKHLIHETDETLTFNYNVNNYGADSTTSSFPLGFGVYQFSLEYSIDGTFYEKNSDIVEVLPTPITEIPEISYMVVPNTQAQLNGFSFKIENLSYKFCDERQIEWFASTTVNNLPWTLDEYYHSLQRTGTEFLFMPDFQNQFTVWCVVSPDGAGPIYTSESLAVSTIRNNGDHTMFWVIIASSIGTIFIVSIIFALIKSKREKIW